MNQENQDVEISSTEIEEHRALRKRAEERMRAMPALHNPTSIAAAGTVLHELRLHQIEVELQNEALRDSQEKLELSRARYFELYNLAPVGFLNLDKDSGILEANRAAAMLLGVPRERLLFHNLTKYILPEDQDAFYLNRRRLIESRVPQEFELRLNHNNTSIIWVSIQAEIAEDPEATLIIRAVLTDITLRKKAEETLRLLGAALEAAANAILITDVQGTIEWVNPAFRLLTGYTAEETIGRNPRDLIKSGIQDAAFYKSQWETILDGRVWQAELINQRKDGTHYYEEQTITPVRDREGRVTHFVDIKLDISDRKRLEQELLQAQKMESVGRLAGGVAHDFNNLLTVISGFTELALSEVNVENDLHNDLTQVLEASRRATALTRQLLAFSRRQVLSPEPIDLHEVVMNCLEMLRRLVGENYELDCAPAVVTGIVLADPGQMEQVVMNLVLNARDAMPMGGHVWIETSNLLFEHSITIGHTPLQAGKYVCLSVMDTGIGMDEATLLRIFEPFFTTKSMGAGTGIGLATVYGIVTQSGGSIAVISKPGMGSTFKIYLPRIIAESTAAVAAQRKKIVGGIEHILVVEDEPALRTLTDRILTQAGYSTIMAVNGDDALEQMERQSKPVDLVLTDMIMPGINGQELAEMLKTRYPGLKSLYMSGYTASAMTGPGDDESNIQLLGKPYTAEELTEKIREVLDKK